ncbi:MAG: Methyltransferase type 12 [Sphingomonas bacterium]|nr:Methyltransferase type 12 [Sphingomonas bacterium]
MPAAPPRESPDVAALAQAAAWRAFAAAPDDIEARQRLVERLQDAPEAIDPAHEPALHALLGDASVDPQTLVPAGWALLDKTGRMPTTLEAAAAWLEHDEFARELLAAGFVATLAPEQALTALRRWLLLSGRWRDYPAALAALVAQADHNGGAWLIDAEEQALLDAEPAAPIVRAYLPPPPDLPDTPDYATPMTSTVAAHYILRPYPAWRRPMVVVPSTLPAMVAKLGPGAPTDLPVAADILIAGCGTGREAAHWALRCPDAQITAIDISPASLAFAAERCAAAGIGNITFHQLDLHNVATLGRQFDAVVCSGVLHHLADPERGWAAITGVLKPGGVMSLMVYSAYVRLRVMRARHLLADLHALPLSDAVLRAARARLMRDMPTIAGSFDFYTLTGVHDLLFHEQEDPFDITRIMRGMEALGLDFLGFRLTAGPRARYRRDHPQDPYRRDVEAWRALDRERPHPGRGLHHWWCAKPA